MMNEEKLEWRKVARTREELNNLLLFPFSPSTAILKLGWEKDSRKFDGDDDDNGGSRDA